MDEIYIHSIVEIAIEGCEGCTFQELLDLLSDRYRRLGGEIDVYDDDISLKLWSHLKKTPKISFFEFSSYIDGDDVDYKYTKFGYLSNRKRRTLPVEEFNRVSSLPIPDTIRLMVKYPLRFQISGIPISEKRMSPKDICCLETITRSRADGIGSVDLATELGLDPKQCHYHVKKLRTAGHAYFDEIQNVKGKPKVIYSTKVKRKELLSPTIQKRFNVEDISSYELLEESSYQDYLLVKKHIGSIILHHLHLSRPKYAIVERDLLIKLGFGNHRKLLRDISRKISELASKPLIKFEVVRGKVHKDGKGGIHRILKLRQESIHLHEQENRIFEEKKMKDEDDDDEEEQQQLQNQNQTQEEEQEEELEKDDKREKGESFMGISPPTSVRKNAEFEAMAPQVNQMYKFIRSFGEDGVSRMVCKQRFGVDSKLFATLLGHLQRRGFIRDLGRDTLVDCYSHITDEYIDEDIFQQQQQQQQPTKEEEQIKLVDKMRDEDDDDEEEEEEEVAVVVKEKEKEKEGDSEEDDEYFMYFDKEMKNKILKELEEDETIPPGIDITKFIRTDYSKTNYDRLLMTIKHVQKMKIVGFRTLMMLLTADRRTIMRILETIQTTHPEFLRIENLMIPGKTAGMRMMRIIVLKEIDGYDEKKRVSIFNDFISAFRNLSKKKSDKAQYIETFDLLGRKDRRKRKRKRRSRRSRRSRKKKNKKKKKKKSGSNSNSDDSSSSSSSSTYDDSDDEDYVYEEEEDNKMIDEDEDDDDTKKKKKKTKKRKRRRKKRKKDFGIDRLEEKKNRLFRYDYFKVRNGNIIPFFKRVRKFHLFLYDYCKEFIKNNNNNQQTQQQQTQQQQQTESNNNNNNNNGIFNVYIDKGMKCKNFIDVMTPKLFFEIIGAREEVFEELIDQFSSSSSTSTSTTTTLLSSTKIKDLPEKYKHLFFSSLDYNISVKYVGLYYASLIELGVLKSSVGNKGGLKLSQFGSIQHPVYNKSFSGNNNKQQEQQEQEEEEEGEEEEGEDVEIKKNIDLKNYKFTDSKESVIEFWNEVERISVDKIRSGKSSQKTTKLSSSIDEYIDDDDDDDDEEEELEEELDNNNTSQQQKEMKTTSPIQSYSNPKSKVWDRFFHFQNWKIGELKSYHIYKQIRNFYHRVKKKVKKEIEKEEKLKQQQQQQQQQQQNENQKKKKEEEEEKDDDDDNKNEEEEVKLIKVIEISDSDSDDDDDIYENLSEDESEDDETEEEEEEDNNNNNERKKKKKEEFMRRMKIRPSYEECIEFNSRYNIPRYKTLYIFFKPEYRRHMSEYYRKRLENGSFKPSRSIAQKSKKKKKRRRKKKKKKKKMRDEDETSSDEEEDVDNDDNDRIRKRRNRLKKKDEIQLLKMIIRRKYGRLKPKYSRCTTRKERIGCENEILCFDSIPWKKLSESQSLRKSLKHQKNISKRVKILEKSWNSICPAHIPLTNESFKNYLVVRSTDKGRDGSGSSSSSTTEVVFSSSGGDTFIDGEEKRLIEKERNLEIFIKSSIHKLYFSYHSVKKRIRRTCSKVLSYLERLPNFPVNSSSSSSTTTTTFTHQQKHKKKKIMENCRNRKRNELIESLHNELDKYVSELIMSSNPLEPPLFKSTIKKLEDEYESYLTGLNSNPSQPQPQPHPPETRFYQTYFEKKNIQQQPQKRLVILNPLSGRHDDDFRKRRMKEKEEKETQLRNAKDISLYQFLLNYFILSNHKKEFSNTIIGNRKIDNNIDLKTSIEKYLLESSIIPQKKKNPFLLLLQNQQQRSQQQKQESRLSKVIEYMKFQDLIMDRKKSTKILEQEEQQQQQQLTLPGHKPSRKLNMMIHPKFFTPQCVSEISKFEKIINHPFFLLLSSSDNNNNIQEQQKKEEEEEEDDDENKIFLVREDYDDEDDVKIGVLKKILSGTELVVLMYHMQWKKDIRLTQYKFFQNHEEQEKMRDEDNNNNNNNKDDENVEKKKIKQKKKKIFKRRRKLKRHQNDFQVKFLKMFNTDSTTLRDYENEKQMYLAKKKRKLQNYSLVVEQKQKQKQQEMRDEDEEIEEEEIEEEEEKEVEIIRMGKRRREETEEEIKEIKEINEIEEIEEEEKKKSLKKRKISEIQEQDEFIEKNTIILFEDYDSEEEVEEEEEEEGMIHKKKKYKELEPFLNYFKPSMIIMNNNNNMNDEIFQKWKDEVEKIYQFIYESGTTGILKNQLIMNVMMMMMILMNNNMMSEEEESTTTTMMAMKIVMKKIENLLDLMEDFEIIFHVSQGNHIFYLSTKRNQKKQQLRSSSDQQQQQQQKQKQKQQQGGREENKRRKKMSDEDEEEEEEEDIMSPFFMPLISKNKEKEEEEEEEEQKFIQIKSFQKANGELHSSLIRKLELKIYEIVDQNPGILKNKIISSSSSSTLHNNNKKKKEEEEEEEKSLEMMINEYEKVFGCFEMKNLLDNMVRKEMICERNVTMDEPSCLFDADRKTEEKICLYSCSLHK